ncbi:MAG: hypothetical protein JKY65_30580 [Planctomycetes bacterium]|nr:hypothetical protein [Planctomycetota bacterium]
MSSWQPSRALCLAALWVLSVAPLCAGAPETSTLKRPESPVIVPGRNLKPFLKRSIDTIRLYAFRDGKLRPIPFQIDERTADDQIAFQAGEDRRSDVDDGRLDANDELVFMGRDVGDRAPPASIKLGQSDYAELIVKDPRGRGWVYLVHFAQAPPPRAQGRYVSLDFRGDELLGWTAQRVQAKVGPDGHALDLRSLRFARAKGGYGIDILDRTKLHLRASYLFLDIQRRFDEVRSSWRSYRQGPVRVIAGVQAETYLTWGRWLSTTRRSTLVIYGNRLELRSQFELPIDLEANKPSSLRLSFDFSPTAGDVRVWSNRNPKPIRCNGQGTDPKLSKLKTSGAEWIACATPAGAVVLRLRLDAQLQKRRHRFFLRDGPAPDLPEDAVGSRGNAGFELDLAGLQAGRYEFSLSAHFLRAPLEPGGESAALSVEDAPLVCEALAKTPPKKSGGAKPKKTDKK